MNESALDILKTIESRVQELEARDRVQEARVNNLAAQIGAFRIKDIKFFPGDVTIDGNSNPAVGTISFPERVDYIVTESILNDNQLFYHYQYSRVDENVFNVSVTGILEHGKRWIPRIKFWGIQLTR